MLFNSLIQLAYIIDYSMNNVLLFLSKLTKNNHREWFEKNKPAYLAAKEEFETMVAAVLRETVKFQPDYAHLEARKLIFRIYRDVRFSKDKKPYKTNMGAGFSPGGKLIQEPGYYLHIEPGNKSFIAGGLYMPEPPLLANVRQEIDYNGEKLKKIFSKADFKKTMGGWDETDKLKKIPKGYAPDHPLAEWLKLKSFVVGCKLTDNQVTRPGFAKEAAKVFKTIKPLNEFLKEAIA